MRGRHAALGSADRRLRAVDRARLEVNECEVDDGDGGGENGNRLSPQPPVQPPPPPLLLAECACRKGE